MDKFKSKKKVDIYNDNRPKIEKIGDYQNEKHTT